MAHIHVPTDIPVRYLPRSRTANLLFGALFAVGLLGFLVGLGSDPERAWQAYVVNWLYFTSVAMGAVMFAAVTTIVKAKWNWSIKRVSVAFVAFLPVSFLFFLPMLTLGENYFPWIEEMAAGDEIVLAKAAYLNLPFLYARNVVGLLALFGIGLAFAWFTLRPDSGLAKGNPDEDAGRQGWRERLSQGWGGQDAEEMRSWRRLRVLGPVMAITYAAVMSIISFDWAMSLDSHWFSTLFGWWFFMAAFWGGIAASAWTVVWLKRQHADFDRNMGRQQLHDIGKLAFAFTVFWTYLFWSQYIVIWYGKLPWEQGWMIDRLDQPWGGMALLTFVLCFIIPFTVLISRQKMKPAVLMAGTTSILVGLWMERYMLVAPSVRTQGPVFPGTELMVGLMFLGAFLFSVRWFLTTFPVIQLWQPPVEPEMMEAEVFHDGRGAGV